MDRIGDYLEPETVTDAFRVALAVELRGKDTYSRSRSEDDEVEDEYELIGDRDTRYRVGADAADHEIIQKINEIGQAVLEHHRNCDAQYFGIEFLSAQSRSDIHGRLLSFS